MTASGTCFNFASYFDEETGWTQKEDETIVNHVRNHGTRNWSIVAAALKNRNARQCSRRFSNHLHPDINFGQWLDEEDRFIVLAHAYYGNRWKEIAKHLPGRTCHDIREHWTGSLERNRDQIAAEIEKSGITIPLKDQEIKEADIRKIKEILMRDAVSTLPVCPAPSSTPMLGSSIATATIHLDSAKNHSNNSLKRKRHQIAAEVEKSGLTVPLKDREIKKAKIYQKWLVEEDWILVLAQAHYGNRWKEIAKHLPGRNRKDINDHWDRSLKRKRDQIAAEIEKSGLTVPLKDREIKKAKIYQKWLVEEDWILVLAQAHYGNRWKEIAKHLPGRNRKDINDHWDRSLKRKRDQIAAEIEKSGITISLKDQEKKEADIRKIKEILMRDAVSTLPVCPAPSSAPNRGSSIATTNRCRGHRFISKKGIKKLKKFSRSDILNSNTYKRSIAVLRAAGSM